MISINSAVIEKRFNGVRYATLRTAKSAVLMSKHQEYLIQLHESKLVPFEYLAVLCAVTSSDRSTRREVTFGEP